MLGKERPGDTHRSASCLCAGGNPTRNASPTCVWNQVPGSSGIACLANRCPNTPLSNWQDCLLTELNAVNNGCGPRALACYACNAEASTCVASAPLPPAQCCHVHLSASWQSSRFPHEHVYRSDAYTSPSFHVLPRRQPQTCAHVRCNLVPPATAVLAVQNANACLSFHQGMPAATLLQLAWASRP